MTRYSIDPERHELLATWATGEGDLATRIGGGLGAGGKGGPPLLTKRTPGLGGRPRADALVADRALVNTRSAEEPG